MPADTCAKCSKPKSAQAGSITQWINVCVCDATPSVEPETNTLRCKTCGKLIRDQQVGSLTQWIFQQDACSCERPNVEKETPSTSAFKQPAFRGFAETDEIELEIEGEKFPFDRYKPVKILGAGVSGTVYLSRDRLLGKLVAIKVLKTLDRDALVSFQNEAKTTSKLTHPNITKILDFGSTSGGVPYMVMEFVPGSSLEEFIKEYGGLDINTTIRLFIQLSDALDYAHSSQILHRDLKPSNILLVDDDGSLDAHLIDFGVAKLQQQNTTIYNGTALVGTPSYMSPDQALGRQFDKRSDIYSLGCILFETLTGVQAFAADSPLEVISLHAHTLAPSILEYLPENSETVALDRIVRTCLEKDPRLRYQNSSGLKQALRAVPSQGNLNQATEAELPVSEDKATLRKTKDPTSLMLICAAAVTLTLGVAVSLLMASMIFVPEKSVSLELKFEPTLVDDVSKANGNNKELSLNALSRRAGVGNEAREEAELVPPASFVLKRQEDVVSGNDAMLAQRAFANPTVSRLAIVDSDISARGFRELRHLTNLRTLSIDSQPLSVLHFQELSKLNLAALQIKTPDGVDLDGLPYLKSLRYLTRLEIKEANVTKKVLENIAELKSLNTIALPYAAGFSSTSVAPLAKLPKLYNLDVSNSDITDSSIAPVTSFPKLASIFIDDTGVTGAFLTRISSMPKFRNVSIRSCRYIPASAIAKFKKVRPDIGINSNLGAQENGLR